MGRRDSTAVSAHHARAAVTPRRAANQRGTSLVELLTSTLFVSILMAMSYGFARAALISARVQEVKSEAQEATVMALDVLTRELRMAGFSAAAQPLAGLLAANAQSVEVGSDLNGDGDLNDANEDIGYSYDPQQALLMRATGGASPQPFVHGVPRGGLHFSFFDAGGAEIPVPTGGLSAGDRLRVHRIDVLLQVELTNPEARATRPLTSTVSCSVGLRNQ